MFFSYCQARYMYQEGDIWEPHLAQQSAPALGMRPGAALSAQ